jgi:NhaA family Na+:H+ antiporter
MAAPKSALGERRYPLEPLFGRILSPFERFLHRATSGGIVLIASTLLTLTLANSPWGAAIHHFWEQSLGISFGPYFSLEKSLHHWVNDGLMVLFFLLVGMELKREMLVGELSSLRDAALPVMAALGGMICPALIYAAFNPREPALAGWGIPMATDIAFAVGILVLLSWRIPKNLIIFLTALAIADDLGAVLVIAVFYTANLNLHALLAAGAALLVLMLLNRGGIRQPLPYWIVGTVLWYLVLLSGIHATIAGVLLAFTIPARPASTVDQFNAHIDKLQAELQRERSDQSATYAFGNEALASLAESVEQVSNAAQSPLQRVAHGLSPWVTFAIIPIFAFANAGIDFRTLEFGEALSAPVTLGVLCGLVLGKFIGIGLFSWIGVKCGLGRLPSGVLWRHIFGAAWLGGIGFTMSLFIGQLAFADVALVEEAKLGILLASLLAAVIGLTWLWLSADSAVKNSAQGAGVATR